MIKPERQFIASVKRLAQTSANRAVVKGIGDDCAILRIAPRSQLLVTTDLCVENVHFRREWHPAGSVGHRCLARGLSDIAAMGGEPLACFLSIGLPADLPQRWVDDFLRGLLRLARRFGVELAGGDTSAARDITADIIVIGQVLTDKAPTGKALLRSTARPGDRIYVTGELGASAATLKQLYSGKNVKPSTGSRHFYPEPRVEVGSRLRRRGLATAMIDISDGLSVDLAHICQESQVSATIHAASVPIAAGADLELALHGGDDYELLFTAPKGLRLPATIAGVRITEIGSILKRSVKPTIHIIGEDGQARLLKPKGWQHFSKRG
ncbi:MAG: thiamine-phosphate kinase [Acidobacteriia bacterium]|nr:thiamine-phosphate kinase [Terriglobia bacterium]